MSLDILVIDDDEIDREALMRKLKRLRRRISFYEADNRDDALQITNDRKLDLILCDWALSAYRDGLELVSWVRDDKTTRNANVPIILVSGYMDQHLVEESLRCGANTTLEKPIELDELNWCLKDLRV